MIHARRCQTGRSRALPCARGSLARLLGSSALGLLLSLGCVPEPPGEPEPEPVACADTELPVCGDFDGVCDAVEISGTANVMTPLDACSFSLTREVNDNDALIVALPSAIGYNNLTSKIRRLTVDMDNFADAMIADMQRSLLED